MHKNEYTFESFTSSICPEINLAIELALQEGNQIKEKSEGWSKAKQVFFMKDKLTAELRQKIQNISPKLEYCKDAGSPQVDPDESLFVTIVV